MKIIYISDLDKMSFDHWFGTFQKESKKLGYNGPLEKKDFEWYWENYETPQEVAERLVKQLKP